MKSLEKCYLVYLFYNYKSNKKGYAILSKITLFQYAIKLANRESLVFCTEPIFSSLANLLGKHTNINDVPSFMKGYEVNEVEIKYGLIHVSIIKTPSIIIHNFNSNLSFKLKKN